MVDGKVTRCGLEEEEEEEDEESPGARVGAKGP